MRNNTMSGIRHMPPMSYSEIYAQEWEREFGRPVKRRPLIVNEKALVERVRDLEETVREYKLGEKR